MNEHRCHACFGASHPQVFFSGCLGVSGTPPGEALEGRQLMFVLCYKYVKKGVEIEAKTRAIRGHPLYDEKGGFS